MATVIYDFETSGLNPFHDDIIEIGAKLIVPETDTDSSLTEYSCLVQPYSGNLISDKITKITGISNQLLTTEGVSYKQAFTEFLNYLNTIYSKYHSLTLVAHNGNAFDDIFFRRMIRILLFENIADYNLLLTKISFVDSLSLCRYLHPQRYSHSMKSMCQLYNIQNKQAHRAMGDVNALAEIWPMIIAHVTQKHGDSSAPFLRYLTYS